ncbi:DUF3906 family protein [Bacillus sp. H-16]|uniref:DUF3906 family protein n=1 Tax=Alteribacter salitolerans TaxID=2912333 RepID=UPI00196683F2|nr:DUF3906 family protein [Alteribacter salitolerans]MBM7096966.1 DUF3906 family protein [Alteribacter salitolerans]
MKLYRFEATINKKDPVHIVVAAQDESTAFETAEVELEKVYLKMPVIEDLSLIETRRLGKKAGFVLRNQE